MLLTATSRKLAIEEYLSCISGSRLPLSDTNNTELCRTFISGLSIALPVNGIKEYIRLSLVTLEVIGRLFRPRVLLFSEGGILWRETCLLPVCRGRIAQSYSIQSTLLQ